MDIQVVAVTHVIWKIWSARNRRFFHNHFIDLSLACASIATNALVIWQVNWYPPLQGWVKCNIDESAKGCPGRAGCGGIFRSHEANFVGGLYGWTKLWIECDSKLVVEAYKNANMVPWSIRNRWKNCLLLSKSVLFYWLHLLWEKHLCGQLSLL
ncbi:hypothetical protein GmHk_13G036971 [Glycine max]|nr:hypothetical protein GmHk_13G036971 [Glycine max]